MSTLWGASNSFSKEKKSSNIGTGCIVILGLFVLLFWYLSSDNNSSKSKVKTITAKKVEQPTRPTEPDKALAFDIKNMSKKVTKTSIYPIADKRYSVDIFYFMKSAWSEASFLSGASIDMMDICNKLTKHQFKDRVGRIVFFVSGPTVDKYGNEGEDLFMKFYFEMDELVKTKWDNFYSKKFLTFVQSMELKPIGRKLAAAYCQEKDNADESRGFCLKVFTLLAK